MWAERKKKKVDPEKLKIIQAALKGKPLPKQRTITGLFVIMFTDGIPEPDQVIKAHGIQYTADEFFRIVEEEKNLPGDKPNILCFKMDRYCYPLGENPEYIMDERAKGRTDEELLTEAWKRFERMEVGEVTIDDRRRRVLAKLKERRDRQQSEKRHEEWRGLRNLSSIEIIESEEVKQQKEEQRQLSQFVMRTGVSQESLEELKERYHVENRNLGGLEQLIKIYL